MSLIQQALEKTNRAQETRTAPPALPPKVWERDPMGAALERELTQIQQRLPSADQAVAGYDGVVQLLDDDSILRRRGCLLHARVVPADRGAIAHERQSVHALQPDRAALVLLQFNAPLQ